MMKFLGELLIAIGPVLILLTVVIGLGKRKDREHPFDQGVEGPGREDGHK